MPVPLCRCRVLYIGSAVPTITKDGLQGIQQPLRERYPVNENTETKGIDSWLSVWSNGLLVEYIEGAKKTESAFYPITNLHYCAAVRYVNVSGFAIEGGGERFIPLDAPFANPPNSPHPPIFAAIFRRTTGVKVLECHAFICTDEKAANALVRCCFHSYADTISLKMEDKIPGLKAIKETSRSATPSSEQNISETGNNDEFVKDDADWNERAIGQKTWQRRQQSGEYDSASLTYSAKTGTKKSKKKSKQQDEGGVLVPFGQQPSRDQTDQGERIYEVNGHGLYSPQEPPSPHAAYFGPPFRRSSADSIPGPPPRGYPPFRPIHPGMMPPPPPGMIPPPYFARPGVRFFPPPPPPHIAARLGWFPPPPPPFGPPPGARFVFMPPPPLRHPFFGMGPPMPDRPRSPNDGPIITSAESVYDTFPRGAGNYEEPIYMPSNGPPYSSYKPRTPDTNHESYYEIYRRFTDPDKKQVAHTESETSGENNAQYWEAYEARIYRQPHMNEKAFANSLNANSNSKNDDGGSLTPTGTPIPPTSSKKPENNVLGRPATPPADYDLGDLRISDSQPKPQPQRAAAVF